MLTWKMLYMMTVSGRLPEYSATLNTLRPHLLVSSSSWGPKGQRSSTGDPAAGWVTPAGTHLGQQPLLVRADPEAGDGGGREAGAVRELPDTTDLRHGTFPPLLLLVLVLGWGDLNLLLLVWASTGGS